jgi:TatD DNase family protein
MVKLKQLILYKSCVNVCCSQEDIEGYYKLLENDKVYGTFGIHPHDSKYYTDEVEKKLIDCFSNKKAVAWGECGLDYFYNNSEKEVQKKIFARQLQVATKLEKPVVIHSRDAMEDTLNIMKDNLSQDHFIHLHCFTYEGKNKQFKIKANQE